MRGSGKVALALRSSRNEGAHLLLPGGRAAGKGAEMEGRQRKGQEALCVQRTREHTHQQDGIPQGCTMKGF